MTGNFHFKNPLSNFLISVQPPIIPDTIMVEIVGLHSDKIQNKLNGILKKNNKNTAIEIIV
ncbi:MAG: hypothetical protein EAX96_15185 [Candidatus Lokiarchaeota archaeon]|nr:hypothetical protein [Candidatus Lokiarchaeota archaeon]